MEIIVTVKPWQGTYPFDFVDDMTRGEWRWIKKLTGYMPLTLGDGLAGGDPDVSGVLAVIALLRAGRITDDQIPEVWDKLTRASAVDSVTLESEDEPEDADDDGPPEERPSESTDSSGPVTTWSSEISPPNPPEIGTPSSAISESDQAILTG